MNHESFSPPVTFQIEYRQIENFADSRCYGLKTACFSEERNRKHAVIPGKIKNEPTDFYPESAVSNASQKIFDLLNIKYFNILLV
jgi:hypothetical protein